MHGVMISVSPLYTDMIRTGEKQIEFRKQILNDMKEYHMPALFIYETKNQKGCGKVIGMIEHYKVYKPMYLTQPIQNDTEHIQERFTLVKNSYYRYCEYKGVTPNPKEGWFKSKKFITHEKRIGQYDQQYNYAIDFSTFSSFEVPLELSSFRDKEGNPMKRPPQNMCSCVPPELYYVYQTEPGLGCVTTEPQYMEIIGITDNSNRAKKMLMSYIRSYHMTSIG